jgi:pyruvate/2-oxoglutarate dehydrogenase complex dihydrolipoamide dehydrogenase (E3) component
MNMHKDKYDIIVIGCGSGGLSVGLFMGVAGFKVLMIDKSDHHIGGECLNDGCVPSKAIIHVARIAYSARIATHFGVEMNGKIDIQKAIRYVYDKQNTIRQHENATWLREQGVDVALGEAYFTGKDEVEVRGKRYKGKKIVIATGSKPRKLQVPGIEKVKYFDNENIFHIDTLPERLLVIGSGPIGLEIGQTMQRLGSKVTVVSKGNKILEQDDAAVTPILLQKLKEEGIEFYFNAAVDSFSSANEAVIKLHDGTTKRAQMDAVFVGIGRTLELERLQLQNAGIKVQESKIRKDDYLRTTNKNVYVCGDIAGSLFFSHEAEFQARIILNNLFSPFNKKLNNDHISWVTFTDPEVATFGLSEQLLKKRNIRYKRLEQSFEEDDRAVVDSYQYGKLVLLISQGGLLHKEKILGGTMIAPNAGELIQELILANTYQLSINTIFNKIYPYPVAARVNQRAIVEYKQHSLTKAVKKLLHTAFKIFN